MFRSDRIDRVKQCDKYFYRIDHAKGTCIWRTKFYGIPVLAKAMCEDGVVRVIRMNKSDTNLKGRTTFPPKHKTLTGFLSLNVGTGVLHFTIEMRG